MLPQNPLGVLRAAGSRQRTWRCLRAILSAERTLWLVAVAAMGLDLYITAQALQLGFRELNPVARQALEAAGVFGLCGLKAGSLLVALSLRPLVPDQYGGVVPLSLGLPSMCAVSVNSTLLLWVLL